MMGKKRIEKFKKIFEEKRNAIIESIRNKDITVDAEGDEVDVIQGATLNAIREKLSMRDIESLRKIDQALEKIDDGSFGICEECGQPIGEKRIEAIITCSTCIDCANRLEKVSKQFA